MSLYVLLSHSIEKNREQTDFKIERETFNTQQEAIEFFQRVVVNRFIKKAEYELKCKLDNRYIVKVTGSSATITISCGWIIQRVYHVIGSLDLPKIIK